MTGNIEGGLKAAQKNKEKYGNDYYARIGAIGGKKPHPNKGFGSMEPERRIEVGRKGGTISRRTKHGKNI